MSKLQQLRQYFGLAHYCAFCHATVDKSQPICEACYEALPTTPQLTPQVGQQTLLYAFHYQPPIQQALLAIKFGRSLHQVSLLSHLTQVQLLPKIITPPQAILPVPLHPRRLRRRGFNQALELAKPLAKQLGIPLLTNQVIRQRHTAAQTTLNASQRSDNVKQAFAMQANRSFAYQHIALFDDVITTGSTLNALAQLLEEHGVQRIDFYACARALV